MSINRRIPVMTSLSVQVIVMCVVMLIPGCQSDGAAPVSDWMGLHEDELLKIMGPPTEQVTLPGGKVQLIFDHGRLGQHVGTQDSWTCRMYFELDSRGFVQGVSSAGC